MKKSFKSAVAMTSAFALMFSTAVYAAGRAPVPSMMRVSSDGAAQVTVPAQPPAPVQEPAVQAPEPEQPAAPETTANAPVGLPEATATFTPGTYTHTVSGYHEDGPMTVSVTFSENQITGIEVTEHHESTYGQGWAFRSLPAVPDYILVTQSTQGVVDVFAGATSTKNSVIEAVELAIVEAGADPAELQPQSISAPLPGDRFIPGFAEVTVPANTMDVDGNPLAEGATSMLHSEDTDMNLRISFGRNEFHLHTGGTFGLGQGAGGHGESVYTEDRAEGQIGGGTFGGWWFRQVVNHQVNDRQSTQGIDVATGATQSASAIIWGVEEAMRAHGANPSAISPRTQPPTQVLRNPTAEPDSPFFVPGVYTVTVDGHNGPIEARITLDRTTLRRIEVLNHSETEANWNQVWGAEAGHVMRDALYTAGVSGLDDVDTVSGATVSSQALIDAVKAAVAQAWRN